MTFCERQAERDSAGQTVRAYVEMWLARTKGEVSPATWVKYEKTARLFLASLGGKAEHDMSAVKREDITRFRDEQGCRVATSTANVALKIVRLIFAAAEMDEVISRNEARLVKKLKVGPEAGSKRRAFTLQELQKLLSVCDEEWRSLVLFGFYTGARLGDLAFLTWQNLDLESGELAYTSRKTRRTVIVPLSDALRTNIEAMPAGDDPRQPIHPRAWETVKREGRTGTLSRQFGELLADAGLVAPRSHAAKKDGAGRSGRRAVSEVSFHCLRHTANTLMKKAGVPEAVVRDIVGHDSAEVSRLYTHMDGSAKRDGVNRLPKLGDKSKGLSRSGPLARQRKRR